MTRFRFSLLGLAGATAAIAVCCAALIYASALISSLVWGATLLALTLMLLGAILSKPASRGFWIGFATVGWLYALIVYGPLSDLSNVASLEPLLKRAAEAMPQSKKLDSVTITVDSSNPYAMTVEQMFLKVAEDGLTGSPSVNLGQTLVQARSATNADFVDSFVRISQAFIALLLGIAGAVIGHILHRRRSGER